MKHSLRLTTTHDIGREGCNNKLIAILIAPLLLSPQLTPFPPGECLLIRRNCGLGAFIETPLSLPSPPFPEGYQKIAD